MAKSIRLLDCTLRDGGHINQGKFGENVIRNVTEKLAEAQIDIIEAGFLWNEYAGADIARYHTIEEAKRILPKERGISKFSLMADFIDLNHLEENDGTVDYIRLSFKRHRLNWGLQTAKLLMEKGYQCFINPVNCNVYSDEEYIDVLKRVNELHPYGFSIVDTFGVMRLNDLAHRYYLVENNLSKDIAIGLHLHENLGLAYSLAQHFISIASPKRDIIIDGSLMGMGREPGNLCIEQIMDYMVNQFGMNYHLEPVYDLIDDYIVSIKNKHQWGYAIPYALSARYNLHRTYAEYLMRKKRLGTKDIQRVLQQIEPDEAELFNKDYVEKLYLNYMDVKYDDSHDLENISDRICRFDKILVLAPGKSILHYKNEIAKYENDNNCIIAVNFVPEFINPDYVFLTNLKRYDAIKYHLKSELMITSNLMRDISDRSYVIEYTKLAYFDEIFCDDSTLMLFNLLSRLEWKREIEVAGFDGECTKGKLEFYDASYGSVEVSAEKAVKIRGISKQFEKSLGIKSVTPSSYIEERVED